MGDKEGGDPEKKMTKDFLDRWKNIASKYEAKDEKKPPEEAPEKAPGGPERTADEELDHFLEGLGQKPQAPTRKEATEGKGVDDLLAEFGLASKGTREPKQAPAAPPAPAEAPPPRPEPAEEGGQRRVLDTLKKVGLVDKEPEPAAVAEPEAGGEEEEEDEEEEEEEEEEEDSLLLELESLFEDEEPGEAPGGPGGSAPPSDAFEEEDLIAELEVMLEGEEAAEPRAVEGEGAPPVPKPAPAAVASRAPPGAAREPLEAPAAERDEEPEDGAGQEPVHVKPEVPAPPAVVPVGPPEPPRATKARAARPKAGRAGRVNGGRVNGGRVNGGRVNGGRVNGGRVNGGRVNGGRVNGGRVNGGRVNGGRVNGGRVNGGRVNGGRVNGGRVNGGRVNGGRGVLPATVAQARRARVTQVAVAALVTVGLFASLVLIVPTGTGPEGPQVDGNIDDWAGSGTLFYTGDTDAGLDPSLDLREYAIRAEGDTGLWFTAQVGGEFFTRLGGSPARGDVLLVLIDVDGSAATGYEYRGLGADRVVEVAGWSGAMRSATAKAFGNRPAYDWSGFESAGAVQVAVAGGRVEGLVTGLSGVGNQTRAAFVLRGVSPGGAETSDGPSAPATLGGPGVGAVAQPVASGLLQAGASGPSAMLRITVSNPSPREVRLTGLGVSADYAPQVPPSLITGSVWQDNNGNGALETSVDTRLTGPDITFPSVAPAAMTFTSPLAVGTGARVILLVTVDTVPAGVADGTSLRLSLSSGSDLSAEGGAHVSLSTLPPPAGLHPGSYIGAPPAAVAVDGIPTEWASVGGVTDPVGDSSVGAVDITGAKGNASAGTLSFLVSFGDAPLAGALIPAKLPPTAQLPGGGGGGGLPGANPPNPGSDFLFVMFDTDNNASTGYATGGQGYDFGMRVDGKAGAPVPFSAEVLRWEELPSPGWVSVPVDLEVAFGSRSVELGAEIPSVELTARNITATAYSTSWDGAQDSLDGLLIFGNELGTRGGAGPQRTVDIAVGEPTLWPPSQDIPEFQEVLVPVAGAVLIVLISRRRPARPRDARAG